jgi:hypothetical protein
MQKTRYGIDKEIDNGIPLQHLYWSLEVIHQDKQGTLEESTHGMM